jgi:hypothetical protein
MGFRRVPFNPCEPCPPQQLVNAPDPDTRPPTAYVPYQHGSPFEYVYLGSRRRPRNSKTSPGGAALPHSSLSLGLGQAT